MKVNAHVAKTIAAKPKKQKPVQMPIGRPSRRSNAARRH